LSKNFRHFIYNSDSLCTEWQKSHPNAQSAPVWLGASGKHSSWSEYHYSEYFKNFSKNTFAEYARMPRYIRNNSQYEENIPVQDWVIKNDTLTVAGFLCQKAMCQFRGRNYTAWFTFEIPINNGPWKFGGLPGLILKVYDNDMLYSFEVTKIDYGIKKYPIKMHDYKNYKKINREKLLKLQREINEDYFKVVGIIIRNGTFDNSLTSPYQPLELE
jgi:GLPGLI family protein